MLQTTVEKLVLEEIKRQNLFFRFPAPEDVYSSLREQNGLVTHQQVLEATKALENGKKIFRARHYYAT